MGCNFNFMKINIYILIILVSSCYICCNNCISTVEYYNSNDNEFNALENYTIGLEKSGQKLKGFFWGTTDVFSQAREGYLPGYFVLPMDNLEIIGDSISFSLYADENALFNEYVTVDIFTTDEANKGRTRYKHTDYYKGLKTKYKGVIRDDTIYLNNFANDCKTMFIRRL